MDKKDIINESMALAAMNPMVGIRSGNNIMVNVIDHDKDITDGWGSYKVAKNLDNEGIILSIDNNGKVRTDRNDSLDESDIAAFYINTNNADQKFYQLFKESLLPYDDRPVHDKNFLYEYFTGHKLNSIDQTLYDPLLEEIELPKLSKIVNSDQSTIEYNGDITPKEKKEGQYIPNSDFPFNSKDTRSDM